MDEHKKKALKARLIEGVNQANVRWGRIDPWSLIVGLKKFMKELDKTHKRWISEVEVSILIKERIEPILVNMQKIGDEKPISDYINNLALKEKADEIINFLNSFPRSYYFYYKLPNVEHKFFDDCEITKDIKFIKVEDGNKFGLSKGYYLRVLGEGYSDASKNSSAAINSNSKFKQVAYLSFLTRKFELNNYNSKIDIKLTSIPFSDTEFPDELRLSYVNDAFLKYLNYIAINGDFLNALNKESTPPATTKSQGLAALLLKNTEPEFINLKLKYFLESLDEDLNTSSLKNAMEWAYDSKVNDYDQTMAFVQLSVALEAVLGVDAKKDGVTERLADRCAYLIGNNVDERKKIRKEFEKFYSVRSDLIHGRSKRLNNEESIQLYWGAYTLDKVIGRELDLYNLHKKAMLAELKKKSSRP
jgi:hypothetical protein